MDIRFMKDFVFLSRNYRYLLYKCFFNYKTHLNYLSRYDEQSTLNVSSSLILDTENSLQLQVGGFLSVSIGL